MPRPLFGYRVRQRTPQIDPDAARIVRAVLAAPPGSRYRAAMRPGESILTAKKRARYILSHAAQYELGIAREDLMPDPSLALSAASSGAA